MLDPELLPQLCSIATVSSVVAAMVRWEQLRCLCFYWPLVILLEQSQMIETSRSSAGKGHYCALSWMSWFTGVNSFYHGHRCSEEWHRSWYRENCLCSNTGLQRRLEVLSVKEMVWFWLFWLLFPIFAVGRQCRACWCRTKRRYSKSVRLLTAAWCVDREASLGKVLLQLRQVTCMINYKLINY